MSLPKFITKFLPLAPRASNIHKYEYLHCDSSKCYYCSAKPTGFDHVLPVSLAKLMPHFKFSSELLKLVPCCTRCNSIAGNRFFMSLAAKKQFIRTRLDELRIRAQYAEVIDRLDKLLNRRGIV